jgi:hypothetical protein
VTPVRFELTLNGFLDHCLCRWATRPLKNITCGFRLYLICSGNFICFHNTIEVLSEYGLNAATKLFCYLQQAAPSRYVMSLFLFDKLTKRFGRLLNRYPTFSVFVRYLSSESCRVIYQIFLNYFVFISIVLFETLLILTLSLTENIFSSAVSIISF